MGLLGPILSRVAMLAGFHSPAVGFDQPFEMLEACHERAQRSVALLQRLIEHLHRLGNDEPARQAAVDVLRYFDIAAPHHHDDEERHVFPPLLALPRDAVHAPVLDAVRRLQQDHRRMRRLWVRLREALHRLAQGLQTDFSPQQRRLAQDFIALYDRHIALEERVVYPAARHRLDAQALWAMSREMASRRGVGQVRFSAATR
ncbi:MAG: hypothetical protein KatS3mg122_0647 [Caldimonas sp.]|nr:MAG: hypothetical protein KatS3mg122_0647 [Caldimonas sp.]